ncbi:MAG: hypothetical protein R2828_31365 [Saprospiraceae bacterium]
MKHFFLMLLIGVVLCGFTAVIVGWLGAEKKYYYTQTPGSYKNGTQVDKDRYDITMEEYRYIERVFHKQVALYTGGGLIGIYILILAFSELNKPQQKSED